MHPLPALMNQGVHVALCSDDPAVFGNMGLSFDFFQVGARILYADSACSHIRIRMRCWANADERDINRHKFIDWIDETEQKVLL